MNEVKKALSEGFKEITLLGQNVDSYHGENEKGEDVNLSALLRARTKTSRPRLLPERAHRRTVPPRFPHLLRILKTLKPKTPASAILPSKTLLRHMFSQQLPI